jgi:hypothetical protein
MTTKRFTLGRRAEIEVVKFHDENEVTLKLVEGTAERDAAHRVDPKLLAERLRAIADYVELDEWPLEGIVPPMAFLSAMKMLSFAERGPFLRKGTKSRDAFEWCVRKGHARWEGPNPAIVPDSTVWADGVKEWLRKINEEGDSDE